MDRTITRIPNAALTPADLPAVDASWGEICEFALTYDGYAETGSFEACAAIANERRAETLDDLRTCLFFEQRRWRHGGYASEGEALEYLRGLVSQMRKLLMARSGHEDRRPECDRPAQRRPGDFAMTAFTRPVLLPAVGAAQLLDRMSLVSATSKAAYDENWLQEILYRNPASLPIQDIDGSVTDVVPMCREMPTPVGPIDVVYLTRDGRPVLVEAKLWRNPEARRAVIGQILDYAKELSRWTAGDFDAAVRRARRREDGGAQKGMLDVLGIDKDSPDAAHFHDALTRNLHRGEFLLLIVGDGIREGVGAITEFLEGHGSLHFTFGLIEVAIFRLPDGGHLVQPRVLVESDIVKRIVVDLRAEKVEEDGLTEAGESEDGPPDNERAQALRAFWSAFLGELVLDNTSQPVGPPSSGGNQFFKMPADSEAWVSAYVARAADKAGVYLTFKKGAIGDRLYAALERDRDAVERDLGIPVEWKSDGVKHWIMTEEKFPGPLLEASAVSARTRLVEWTNRYVNTFRPRLERLVRELT